MSLGAKGLRATGQRGRRKVSPAVGGRSEDGREDGRRDGRQQAGSAVKGTAGWFGIRIA